MGPSASMAQQQFHVRAGANGANNGSDWTNAFSSLPTTLQRGATYYLADGSYGKHAFDDPASGATLIRIKKATIADHGTGTGWDNTYGDGQATFTAQLDIVSSYWVLDGNNGGGPNGCGFKVVNATSAAYGIRIPGSDNITLRYIEVDGAGSSISGQGIAWYPIPRISLFPIAISITRLTIRWRRQTDVPISSSKIASSGRAETPAGRTATCSL